MRARSPRTRAPCWRSPVAATCRWRSGGSGPLVKPLATSGRPTARAGSGTRSCLPPPAPCEDVDGAQLDHRHGARKAGRGDPGDARAADEPRRRAGAGTLAPQPARRLGADGRRVRRAGQHDADERMEHPRRPGRGEGLVRGLGARPRRWRPGREPPAGARASTSPRRRASGRSTCATSRSAPACSRSTRRRSAPSRRRRSARSRPTRSSGSSSTRFASTSSSTRGTTASTARSSTIPSRLRRPSTARSSGPSRSSSTSRPDRVWHTA